MLKHITSSWMGLALLIGLTVVALALAGSLALKRASTHIISQNTESTALAWAEYVGNELEPIQAITGGTPLTAKQREFLLGVTNHGPVFRFKLFDRSGRLIIVSDDLKSGVWPPQDSDSHSDSARLVAENGRPITDLKSGVDKPDRPDVYAESYVPVMSGGEVVAITEVYVDQTAATAKVNKDFLNFGLTIAGLTLLALAIPFAALIMLARRVRRQNEVLHEEKERVQAAEQAKAEFLANMSHELRTPLNAINGFSELLSEETFGPLGNPEYKKYSVAIHDSGRHLLELINDVLDISKIEAGKAELHEETFDPVTVIDSCLTMIRERAIDGNIKLTVEVEEQTLPQLHADKTRIMQVLLNLLSNAVKFTEAGGQVTVKAWRDGDGGLAFQVADTGIGIAASDIPKALTRFQQVEGGLNRRHEGTGLGLPLAKSFVELHGGAIDLQSELGVGTTVTVRLPATRCLSKAA